MRALLVSLLVLFASAAAASPDSGKQQELKELRGRIQALQEEMEQAREDRSEVSDALKKSERRISDVNRGLRDLELRKRRLSRDLQQLNEDTRATQSEIAEQQKRLAELLRERYMQGGGDAMKLLLNGQNPSEVARNLEYYGYIGRARADLIRAHRESLARLRGLHEKTRQQNDDLTRVQQDKVAQRKTLEAEKGERQQVLYKLSEQIRKQRREIDTLARDEKRLATLIARLAKITPARPAAAKPGQKVERVADASLAGLDFVRLRGRLALPVAGEIRHKFGQGREGGGPAWKGLFIRARQGQEVRAVGSGQVAFADWLRGFGNLLIVDHGAGYLSLYSG